MIILGIDPGSRITGYGLVEKKGSQTRHVQNGSLYLESEGAFEQRLVALFKNLKAVIQKYSPEAVVVENVFHAKNAKSLQKLSEVRGVILFVAAYHQVSLFEYTALQIKKAVTGYGNATKDQMQIMVSKILGLRDLAEENASDALGGAICHAHSMTSLPPKGKIQAGEKKLKRNPKLELLKQASFYR